MCWELNTSPAGKSEKGCWTSSDWSYLLSVSQPDTPTADRQVQWKRGLENAQRSLSLVGSVSGTFRTLQI